MCVGGGNDDDRGGWRRGNDDTGGWRQEDQEAAERAMVSWRRGNDDTGGWRQEDQEAAERAMVSLGGSQPPHPAMQISVDLDEHK